MFTINLNVLVTMFLKCELLHVFELFFHLCYCTSKVTTENLHSRILILVKQKTAFGVSNVDTVLHKERAKTIKFGRTGNLPVNCKVFDTLFDDIEETVILTSWDGCLSSKNIRKLSSNFPAV